MLAALIESPPQGRYGVESSGGGGRYNEDYLGVRADPGSDGVAMTKSNTLNVLGRMISNPKQFARAWKQTQQDLARIRDDLSLTKHELVETRQRLAEADRRVSDQGKQRLISIQWEQVVAEFDRMGELDQGRAITKEQMAWLTEVAQIVPVKEALDLGFGCSFAAVAMVRGGCAVTCINNEPPSVPRRIEAEQRYERICGAPPTIITASTDRALPKLCDEGRRFGLIFVDAGHRMDDVFIDVHYAKDLCVPGGVLALDDTYYGAIRTVANWVMSNLGHIWKPHQILRNTISWTRTEIVGDDGRIGLTHRGHAGPPIAFESATENGDEFLIYAGSNQGFSPWKQELGSSETPGSVGPRSV
jgi:predicted O-methyltransferase YrrM